MKPIFCLFVIFLALATEILADPTCPMGFYMANNKCLRVYSDHTKHFEAEQTCRGFGGTMVSVNNAIDNRAIVSHASNSGAAYVWLGIFCFGNQSSTCYQDDGSGSVKYSNFAPGNPVVDLTIRDGNCVYMPTFGSDAGKWYSGPCEWTGIGFVCELPTTVNDTSCTYNYNGNCYFPSNTLAIPDVDRDYYEALNICHVHSMELLSIHSRREIDYIKSIYKNSGIVQLTLGAHAYQPNLFDWNDGSNFDYDNFDPLDNSTGNCLLMDLSDRDDVGMWYQTNCTEVKYFMCVRKAGANTGAAEVQQRRVNSKFQSSKRDRSTTILSFSDFSNCNTTLLVAPGVVTSLGYPNIPPLEGFCTWKIAVLGPYRLGLYFTDFSVVDPVYIYSENNTLLASIDDDKRPFSFLAPSNLVTLTHSTSEKDGVYNFHGFSATILPY